MNHNCLHNMFILLSHLMKKSHYLLKLLFHLQMIFCLLVGKAVAFISENEKFALLSMW